MLRRQQDFAFGRSAAASCRLAGAPVSVRAVHLLRYIVVIVVVEHGRFRGRTASCGTGRTLRSSRLTSSRSQASQRHQDRRYRDLHPSRRARESAAEVHGRGLTRTAPAHPGPAKPASSRLSLVFDLLPLSGASIFGRAAPHLPPLAAVTQERPHILHALG
ncbi:hypothetical protein AAT19DRAFT_12832 [Rhodotorula toruloides]|uniref:Uncharacterized protein n=1 Tax=Rhodotorula toruloides TaxID=5286 RepID=A0A2T0ACT2_RHOTO|nr:hypothetical protein AAT19DRAFT_12832 [Rhodotorula toruloides]